MGDRRVARLAVSALVVVHLLATIWHGDAHTRLHVDLSPAQTIFVYVVILAAPLASAGLMWTRHVSLGLWLFTLAMLGALLFGVYHHYVLVSPDNIAHLPAGSPDAQARFIASAAAIAWIELASALYGAFALGSQHARWRSRA